MTTKDFLIVILMVVGFYAVTYFMFTHYKEIAMWFFAGLFMLGMSVFAYGSWHVLGCSNNSN